MRLRRGVLHTPLDCFQRKRMNVFRFQVYPFIPYGMFVGRMQYAPTRVRVFDRWVVRVFLGRGVLHTPLDHYQQKRTIIWGFMVYPFIPCGMFVGRMQYAPTRVHVLDRWMVEMFSGRGVFIRPSIIPNENGQSFGDLWSIRPSLAGCLWGVCNTPLHGCAYLRDERYRNPLLSETIRD